MADDRFEACLEEARFRLAGADGADDVRAAGGHVDAALALQPRHAAAWMLKSQVLSLLGDDVAAWACAEMAVRAAPQSAEAHFVRAAVLADLDRPDEGLRALDAAEARVGEDDAWLREDIWYERAVILHGAGRNAEAVSVLERGLARFPDSEVLRAGLAPLRRAQVRAGLRLIPGGRR
jgi:tetratricopeptide (TPR) repeat protein